VAVKTSYKVSEKDLQNAVIGAAQTFGWRVAHFRSVPVTYKDRNGVTRVRYQTPVQADGAGFPDLVMVRAPRVIFSELKVGKNEPSEAQAAWIHELAACCRPIAGESPHPHLSVEVYVWRPGDWFAGTIESVLR
jgi:hypothetical protein